MASTPLTVFAYSAYFACPAYFAAYSESFAYFKVLEIVFSWFSFFGSSVAHLEAELELFEVWEFGSWCHWRWWWFVARFSPKLQTALALVLDKLKLSCLPTQSLLPLLYFPLFSPFYRFALFTILWHWNILGGESQEHPPILYEFNFGSLTNASLREIERELTEVSWLSIFI